MVKWKKAYLENMQRMHGVRINTLEFCLVKLDINFCLFQHAPSKINLNKEEKKKKK